jgi:putative aldouronate transport system permease protein
MFDNKAVFAARGTIKHSQWLRIRRNWGLYLLLLPTIAYFVIFHYIPMAGVQIGFKDFRAIDGIWGSPWVGLKHFRRFFSSYNFVIVLKNTLAISFLQIIFNFPIPILLALLLNHLRSRGFKKIVQTITYAPHFISTVVMVGILRIFCAPSSGIINHLIELLGRERIYFFAEPGWFRPLYIISGIWQNAGWASIVYLAALTGIDPALHEAAMVDGASKFKRILNIDIPGILPTAVVMLIMETGRIMSIGFEKVFLMQTPLNLDNSEVISTYVYKIGLLNVQYSYSAAIGLFNSVINLILILSVNALSRRISESSLW